MDIVALYCGGDRVYCRHIAGVVLMSVGAPFSKDILVLLNATVLLNLFCLYCGFACRIDHVLACRRSHKFSSIVLKERQHHNVL